LTINQVNNLASEILKQCNRADSDGSIFDTDLLLINDERVSQLVGMILQETKNFDEKNYLWTAEYKPSLCWLLVKWGYTERLLSHCFEVNGAWSEDFVKNNKNFN